MDELRQTDGQTDDRQSNRQIDRHTHSLCTHIHVHVHIYIYTHTHTQPNMALPSLITMVAHVYI